MPLSSLPDQVLECKIDILDGGTSVTGFPVTIRIKDEKLDFKPVFWGDESDTSLGGNKRSNIRGYDVTLRLDYEASLEEQKMKDIFDQLPNLVSSSYELRVYPNAGGTDYITMIPTSAMALAIRYSSTVRVGGADGVIPTMEFQSDSLEQALDDFFST